MREESLRLRARAGALETAAANAFPDPVGGAPALLAQTKVLSSYPTTAQAFYAVSVLAVLGAEVEGGAATVSAQTGTLFALNLGGTVPPVGSQVVVTNVGNRWVFRYD